MGTTSTSSAICSAIVSYKKKPGILSLTETHLVWVPKDGLASGSMTVERRKLDALFASKDGSPKVMLRICARSSQASGDGQAAEEVFNFTFTSPTDAIAEREALKVQVSQVIGHNRTLRDQPSEFRPATDPSPTQPDPSSSSNLAPPSSEPPDKGKSVDPLQDWRLKKRVLQNDDELRQLHKDMVIGGHITEGEFWDGREELLYHEARLDAQKRGRSAQMVDPRPESTDTGDITISVTPQLIHDIFEQYPVVQKAYNENVPPMNDQTFWGRYFQSRLFNRHRSSARQPGDAVKDDEVFDKYLDDDDDGIVPKNLKVHEVYRLLDLAATEEDHVETGNSNDWTMRAGTQRSLLPLMRRFNEHSERLLNSSLGNIPTKRAGGVIEGGDAGSRNYYGDTALVDLTSARKSDHIVLDIQGQERYFQGSSAAPDSSTNSKRKRAPEQEQASAEQICNRVRNEWKVNLARLNDENVDINEATIEMIANITTRYKQRHGFKEGGIPASLMSQVISTHSTANEFLRHYWSAILPSPSQSTPNASGPPKRNLSAEEKAMKAQRMIGFLERTSQRVQMLIEEASASSVDKKLIFQALESTIRAVEKAQRHYNDRLG